jgi:hypothetical protein
LPSESPEVAKELLGEPDGVDRICRSLHDACALESSVVQALSAATTAGTRG